MHTVLLWLRPRQSQIWKILVHAFFSLRGLDRGTILNNMGYSRITFYRGERRERIFRHRLIAKMFVDNPDGHDEVNHIDEDKSHNSADNLEWVSRTMNERANHRSFGKPYTPFTVWFHDGTVRSYEFAVDLAEELGVTRRTVHNWLEGRVKGYRNHGIESLSYD